MTERQDTAKSRMTDQRQLQHLRWMLMDALNHAAGLAARAQEATEGTDATLLFSDARQAISKFREEDHAMQALATAAVRHLL